MSKTRDDEAYEQGVHDGQNAGLFEQITQKIAEDFVPSTHTMDVYDKGFEYGKNHPSEKSDDSDSGSSSGCFLSTACTMAAGLRDDCHELVVLRMFRDTHLTQRPDGSQMVERYYEVAPRILAAIQAEPDALDVLRRLFADLVVPSVSLIEAGRYEDAVALYRGVVTDLEGQYARESAGAA